MERSHVPTPRAPGLIRKETKKRRGKGQEEWPEKASERQLLFNGRRKQWLDKTARGESRWRQRREAALRGITSSTGRRRGCFCFGTESDCVSHANLKSSPLKHCVHQCPDYDSNYKAMLSRSVQMSICFMHLLGGGTSGSEYVGTFRANRLNEVLSSDWIKLSAGEAALATDTSFTSTLRLTVTQNHLRCLFHLSGGSQAHTSLSG